MTRTLWQRLRQSKPFEILEEEVFLQILFTAQVSGRWVSEALRPFELTAAQHNVLRILRGVSPGSLPAGRIAERMVHHDPDLTRLLDRLEAAGLVEKTRDDRDRRVVNVRITEQGLTVVEGAGKAVRATVETRFRPLGPKKLSALADLLEMLRAASAGAEASQQRPPAKQVARSRARSVSAPGRSRISKQGRNTIQKPRP